MGTWVAGSTMTQSASQRSTGTDLTPRRSTTRSARRRSFLGEWGRPAREALSLLADVEEPRALQIGLWSHCALQAFTSCKCGGGINSFLPRGSLVHAQSVPYRVQSVQ